MAFGLLRLQRPTTPWLASWRCSQNRNCQLAKADKFGRTKLPAPPYWPISRFLTGWGDARLYDRLLGNQVEANMPTGLCLGIFHMRGHCMTSGAGLAADARRLLSVGRGVFGS